MERIVKGIAHAAYTVRDMDTAVDFYRKTFGFERPLP